MANLYAIKQGKRSFIGRMRLSKALDRAQRLADRGAAVLIEVA